MKRKQPKACQRKACRACRAEVERLTIANLQLATACNERAAEILVHSRRGDQYDALRSSVILSRTALNKSIDALNQLLAYALREAER